jgi:hypothetical protein
MLSGATVFTRGGTILIFVSPWIAIQTIDSTNTGHVLANFTIDTGFIAGQRLMLSGATVFTRGGTILIFVRPWYTGQTSSGTIVTLVLPNATNHTTAITHSFPTQRTFNTRSTVLSTFTPPTWTRFAKPSRIAT